MNLEASVELISTAEQEMGLSFPGGLKQVWAISNGLELPGGWQLFPVFDPANARKTSNHIFYENTRARWDYMAEDLITIANGDTGNCLVLKCEDNRLGDEIYHWNHETNRTKKWGKSWDYILSKAESRIARIKAQIARSNKQRKNA